MGKFINEAAQEGKAKRKHPQTVTVPIVINDDDLPALQEFAEAAPDSYEVVVTGTTASKETADAEIRYSARGANVTDVTRRLDEAGFRYAHAKTKTARTCDCANGHMSCEA